MKFAAVSMKGKTADVKGNTAFAYECIEKAAEQGAEFIVLPEFFNTGFGLHKDMQKAIKEIADTEEVLKSWSKDLQVIISGSYLHYDKNTKDVYNSFVIVFPDGTVYRHDKDIPTAMEALYYTYGDSVRVFDTPVGRIGIAMCWEQIRSQTIRAMQGKVDFVVAGSCWWNFCPEDSGSMYVKLSENNAAMAQEAPIQMACLLGVPVIHASHDCRYESVSIGNGSKTCFRQIEGNTMIVDEEGNTMAACHSQQEDSFVMAEVEKGKGKNHSDIPKRQYWIPRMPMKLRMAFRYATCVCHKKYMQGLKNRNLL